MNDKNFEIPIGLAMALAVNEQAMLLYSGMTNEQRQSVKSKAMQATSKAEMQRIVQNIADGEFN